MADKIDPIKNPPHYTNKRDRPIDYIIKNGSRCEGNVVKYICRWRSKGGIDDLKAKQYIDFIIEKDNPKQLNLELMTIKHKHLLVQK